MYRTSEKDKTIMITALILSFVSGLLTHYSNALVRNVSTPGWRSISFYIIRTTLKIPSILLVHNNLKDDIEDGDKLTLVCYIIASCAYGLGVIFAWLIEGHESES